jgi:hypothetical protein
MRAMKIIVRDAVVAYRQTGGTHWAPLEASRKGISPSESQREPAL